MTLDAGSFRLIVALAAFLAAVHAYRKLSPYFAVTWFGAGLVFGWTWARPADAPEAVLLPVVLVYLAAAVTKGLVENGRFAGNHVLHVIATGAFTGLLALPLESAADAMGWRMPRGAVAAMAGPSWLGGVPSGLVLQWMIVGLAFYGTYKILDHVGLGRAAQTVLLFATMPFLASLVDSAMGLLP